MTTLERTVFALTIYGEARGESLEGKAAVANVIKNRKRSGRWGATYESVCLAPYQFSCWTPKGGLSNYTLIKTLNEAANKGDTLPDDPILRECFGIADAADSWLRDNVKTAQHYLVTQLNPWPSWALGHLPVVIIGNHSFFAGIR